MYIHRAFHGYKRASFLVNKSSINIDTIEFLCSSAMLWKRSAQTLEVDRQLGRRSRQLAVGTCREVVRCLRGGDKLLVCKSSRDRFESLGDDENRLRWGVLVVQKRLKRQQRTNWNVLCKLRLWPWGGYGRGPRPISAHVGGNRSRGRLVGPAGGGEVTIIKINSW